jgi:hypothetical protein
MAAADRLAGCLAVELVEGTPSGAGRQDRHFLRQQDRRDAGQSDPTSTHALPGPRDSRPVIHATGKDDQRVRVVDVDADTVGDLPDAAVARFTEGVIARNPLVLSWVVRLCIARDEEGMTTQHWCLEVVWVSLARELVEPSRVCVPQGPPDGAVHDDVAISLN